MVSKKISRYIFQKCLYWCTYFTVIILGYALQYLFLTTFAIMTCMSCELLMNLRYFLIWKSICKFHIIGRNHIKVHIFLKSFRGNASSNKRYRHEMLGGYGAPLIITLLTCIFQFYRPKCSIVNPRIGEYHCFFPSQWIYQSIYCLPVSIHSVNSPK